MHKTSQSLRHTHTHTYTINKHTHTQYIYIYIYIYIYTTNNTTAGAPRSFSAPRETRPTSASTIRPRSRWPSCYYIPYIYIYICYSIKYVYVCIYIYIYTYMYTLSIIPYMYIYMYVYTYMLSIILYFPLSTLYSLLPLRHDVVHAGHLAKHILRLFDYHYYLIYHHHCYCYV